MGYWIANDETNTIRFYGKREPGVRYWSVGDVVCNETTGDTGKVFELRHDMPDGATVVEVGWMALSFSESLRNGLYRVVTEAQPEPPKVNRRFVTLTLGRSSEGTESWWTFTDVHNAAYALTNACRRYEVPGVIIAVESKPGRFPYPDVTTEVVATCSPTGLTNSIADKWTNGS